jgi:hypothetical protein
MSDDTKTLPHVVTGLIAKRAEIAGEIENLRGRLTLCARRRSLIGFPLVRE